MAKLINRTIAEPTNLYYKYYNNKKVLKNIYFFDKSIILNNKSLYEMPIDFAAIGNRLVSVNPGKVLTSKK